MDRRRKVPQRSKFGYDDRRPRTDKPTIFQEVVKPSVSINDVELAVYSSKEISEMSLDEKLNANLANMSK